MKLIPSGSQTVGPFFKFGLDHPDWADLTGGGKAKGERIVIEGRVTDGEGVAVPDALLEIWQANAAGKYAHPEDRQDKPLDPAFRGFGRCATDKDGGFRFVTIKPGPVPGRGNSLQAPHIAVTLFSRGLLKHLVTRFYFAGEALNDTDPVLGSIDDPEARKSIIVQPTGKEGGATVYRFDVVMQGKGETLFFEV